MHHAGVSALYKPRPLNVSNMHSSEPPMVRKRSVWICMWTGLRFPTRLMIANPYGVVILSGSQWVKIADVWMSARRCLRTPVIPGNIQGGEHGQ